MTAIFINEFHYDNAGTDEAEFIEIAGPAGTDLTGWSVVLYNGDNNAMYATLPLSGVLGDLGQGYGAVEL
ncbi:MAG: lamin tail domain-containing protein, partial [Paracoccus sp. (in: a-proteobacteria)]|nr:lamin tail domain-containing protein [Paracoccus sp. (in: a-proteobacteria)]